MPLFFMHQGEYLPAIRGAQHLELRTPVELMTHLLTLLVVEGRDEGLGEHIALLQPRIGLGELAPHGLGLRLMKRKYDIYYL